MEITDEIQAAINAAVEEATKKLNDKNAELRDENRRFKTEKQEADDARKAADLAKQEAEELREAAEAEAAEKSGDVEKLKQSMQKKHDAELKKLTDRYSALEAAHATLTIDNEITAALNAAGVKPEGVSFLTRALRADAKMVDGVAMVGDVPFADHLANEMKSDAMKAFIIAPHNSGGGALGSNAKAEPHNFTKENRASRRAELMMLEKSDPAKYAAIMNDLGSA